MVTLLPIEFITRQGNNSARFSINFEATASEFQENLEELFLRYYIRLHKQQV